MTFSARVRNFTGVRHEALRRKLDVVINNLHDQLSDCYYNYWRQGQSKSFFIWDVLGTPQGNKRQFDLLQGLIFHLYNMLFHKVNKLDANYPESEYNTPINKTAGFATRYDESRQWIIDTANQHDVNPIAIRDYIIDWVRSNLGYEITLD